MAEEIEGITKSQAEEITAVRLEQKGILEEVLP